MNPEMHEQWALDRVDAYLDGELPEDDRARFETALEASDALRNEVALAQRVQAALRSLPKRNAPQRVLDVAQREAVAVTTFEPARHRPFWPWTTAIAAAAAVLLTVAILRDVNAPVTAPPGEPPAVATTPAAPASTFAATPTPEELAVAREELMMTFAYLGAVQRRGAAAAGTAVDSRVSPAIRTAIDALNLQTDLIQPPDSTGKELTS